MQKTDLTIIKTYLHAALEVFITSKQPKPITEKGIVVLRNLFKDINK